MEAYHKYIERFIETVCKLASTLSLLILPFMSSVRNLIRKFKKIGSVIGVFPHFYQQSVRFADNITSVEARVNGNKTFPEALCYD